ncbi:lig_chan-Glu_bd domain-containing protein [Trichonephila clavipes]|nr:lig_chan-Glu_bd domain-containing protein [Trichonephila clavipes]
MEKQLFSKIFLVLGRPCPGFLSMDQLPPFVIVKNSSGVLVLNGFMPPMVRSVAKWMNITEPEDNYGTWKNNTWSGMIGMLYRNEVDLILNPIIPKASILEFAHFTNPIIIDAYTILSGKKIQEPGLFLYFKVLDTTVWIAMVATAIVLGFTSTTIYKRVLMPKDFSWIQMIRQYSWHFLSYALRQNPTEKYLLRSNKTRLQAFLPLIATLWILGIGLIMSSFQSLLVSKLTIRESQPFVDSMDEFVNTDSTIGIAPVEIQLGDVLENYHTHLEEEYANYRKPPDGADSTSQ